MYCFIRNLAALVLAHVVASTAPVHADNAARGRALDDAIAMFEAARPSLGETTWNIDVAAYRDALTLQQFQSAYWGGTVTVSIVEGIERQADCGRFAAYARIPAESGVITLLLCPQFFSPGADALRRLTVLHEMVHVVAGPDECQAMAFAARIEQAATGRFTPVDRYWQASGCAHSQYRLPE